MERNKFNNLIMFFENQKEDKTLTTLESPKKYNSTKFYDNLIHDIDLLIDNMIVKNFVEFQQK